MTEIPQASTTTTVEPGESFPGLNWIRKNWARIRLAHEGIMVNRVQRVQRMGEVVARNAMTGNHHDASGWPGETGAEAMGVDIGDHVENHYHYAAPIPVKKPMGSLGKAALTAALLGTGAGAGVGIPWLAGLFDKPPAIEQPMPIPPTEYEARLELE